MYNSRKKIEIDVAFELTEAWYCSNESCKVWMRDNFTFSVVPVCMKCQSIMVKKKIELGVVENNSPINTIKT